MRKNLTNRIITAFFIALFVYFTIFSNKYIMTLGFLILSNIAIFEMNNALKNIDYNGLLMPAMIFNTLFLVSTQFIKYESILLLMLLMYVFSMFIYVLFDLKLQLDNIFANIFIAIYITLSYAFILLLGDFKWILFAFVITAFTDTFAYAVGLTIGKHKLIERLSPKKTIEGSIGGIAGALLFTFLFLNYFNFEHRLVIYLFAFIISIVSQVGDLFASYIKRMAGIKDYGNLLIGHGGIMDRFDSLLMVVPLVFLMVKLFF